jgi:hypothetical protein
VDKILPATDAKNGKAFLFYRDPVFYENFYKKIKKPPTGP